MRKILIFLVAAISAIAYSSASKPEETPPPWLEEGRAAFAEGDTLKLVGVLEKWLPKVEKFGPDYEKILFYLGEFYSDLNDIENFYRIFELQDEHNRNELKKECKTVEQHLERANYLALSGRYDEANADFIAAFEMPMTQAQRYKAADAYARFFYENKDFLNGAEYYLTAAKALSDSLGIVKESVIAENKAAFCLFAAEDYSRAIELYNKVYQEMKRLDFSDSICNEKVRMIAVCHQGKKDFKKAAEVFTTYIDGTGEITKARAKGLSSRAFVNRFSGDFESSIADYEKAIAIYEKLGLGTEAAETKNKLDQCLIADGRLPRYSDEETKFVIDKARTLKLIDAEKKSLAQTGNLMGNMFTASSLGLIAGSYALIEDFQAATDYYNQFLPMLRTALEEDFLYRNAEERERSWNQNRIYIDDLNNLFINTPEEMPARQKLPALLYDAQLLSKGVLLTSAVEFEKVMKRIDNADLSAAYDTIKANRLRLDKMREEGRNPDSILALMRKTDRQQIELQRKSADMSRYTDFMKITHADVAKALPADAAAIEFIKIGDSPLSVYNEIIAVIISSDNPDGIVVPFQNESTISAYSELTDLYKSSVLTAVILKNLLPYLEGKKVVYFAPDGPLHSMAIENMTDLPFELVRVSSTKVLCTNSARASIREAALFGNIDYMFADPSAKRSSDDGLASFGELGNTKREIREIAGLLKKGKARVKIYEELKATKKVFLTEPKRPINLLHVATHGKYFNSHKPSDNKDSGDDAMKRSILAFAGANIDGDSAIVNAAEIARMDLHECELVVLSACESGLGQLGYDGVFGLQRGFKNAGAKSLLVSLSPVSDDVTADMMIAFYTRYLDKKNPHTPRAALRAAQNEIRTKYPDDTTWASFILIDALN